MEHNGKHRLLYILRILEQETDEQHPLTLGDIAAQLQQRWNLDAYRVTIQNDIAALIDAGYGIEVIRSTQNRYYYAGRLFEVPELKLMMDAVESSKFITQRKSQALVQKLTALASRHEAEDLQRSLSLSGRIKAGNEKIYYITDVLNTAINQGRKVQFLYFEYAADKQKRLKNNGAPYVLSPYTLTMNGDHYYVVGWSDKHGKLASFRVDRIDQVPELLPQAAVPQPDGYSIGSFTERAFRMFDGNHARVELLCANSMMNTVLDHFGHKVATRQVDGEHFRFTAEVSVSPTFFAWVFQFGGGIRIAGPQEVIDAYHALVRKALAD